MYSIAMGTEAGSNYVRVFDSPEAKEKYINKEYKYTYDALKRYWAAASKEDRAKAKQALYIARMNFMKVYDHVPEEKELA